MANSLGGISGGNTLVSGGVPPATDTTGPTKQAKPAPQRRRTSRSADAPVKPGSVAEILEEAPPDGAVQAPAYGYVLRLLRGREREMGASASGSRSVRDSGTRLSNASGRSFTDIVREIRKRRKLLVTPPIPPGYRKTTQVIRAGQSLFADLTHRLPAVLTAKPMTVSADPVDDEEDAQETATLKEEWTTSFLLGQEGRRAILDGGKTSVWRDCVDNLVNTGRCGWSMTERLDRWSEGNPRFPRYDDYEDDRDEEEADERASGANTADAAEAFIQGKPRGKRQTGASKYLKAVDAFKKATPPFALEAIDPLSLHIVEDENGVEDEAIVVVNRPYRETLAAYGLTPTDREGPGTVQGASLGARYAAGPMGFGRPYPLSDAEPERPYEPEHCETVTYYCSSRRALWLGLADPEKDADYDPECGVWAHYVDGVLVASGPLWGPDWHPLPVFRSYGLTTAMADPTYTGITAPMHLIELIDLLDQIMTMELHVSFWSAWPPLVEEDKQAGAPGAAGLSGDTVLDPERVQRPDQNRTTDGKIVEPGRFYSVPPGRTWRYLTLPAESTVHLERLYTKATALIDLIGIPSVLRGQAGGGTPGYAIAQLMIAARSLYGPVMDNFCAQMATCTQYLWWQVWRRFPEGLPVYFRGDTASGKKKGWRTLNPRDIAPDGPRGEAGRGTPFLACSVEADPLLPVDEAQLEMRGIQAQQSGAVDMLTMRERYFHDPAPERTEARVLADKINTHPLVQESMALRGGVRQGVLTPEMALSWLEGKFGVSTQMAFDQLLQIGAFTKEEAARLLLQMQLAQAMGQQQGMPGMAGPMQVPPPGPGAGPMAGGMPGQGPLPAPGMGLPGQAMPMPAAGQPMMPPPMGPGGPPGMPPPPGAPGMALPMQSGGPIPGTPAPPPGVPALPGMPPVAQLPPPAPFMGPSPQGGGAAYPGQAFQESAMGGGLTGGAPDAYGAQGATAAGGGAAIPPMRGVSPSRAGLPQQQLEPWQRAARDMQR